MTVLEAAVELIRECDINRILAATHRDTDADHRALAEARHRYERLRRRRAH